MLFEIIANYLDTGKRTYKTHTNNKTKIVDEIKPATYYQILGDKKKNKTTIDKQFEYSTYIRDFFVDNKDKGLDQAIKCWKYKKILKGHDKYEKKIYKY